MLTLLPTTGLVISLLTNINTHNKTTKRQNDETTRQPQTHYPEYEETTYHDDGDAGLRRRIRSRQVGVPE
jgi:hypothetical protein